MPVISIAKSVFVAIGLAMLAAGYAGYWATSAFVASAATAQGEVIDIVRSSPGDTTFRPVVRYTTAQGERVEFISTHASNPPQHRRGQKVGVLYNTHQPSKARLDDVSSLWGLWLVWLGLGTVFTMAGASLMIYGPLRARRIARLLEHGTAIEATVVTVERNMGYTFNDQHPYRIVVQGQNPASKSDSYFTSGNIWFDPTAHLTGRSITVFIDPVNPNRYFVDVRFLPNNDSAR